MRKKKTGLDKSVIITFITGAVLSIIISAFKLSKGNDCNNISFSTAETQIEAGKVIHFVTNYNRTANIQWSFGDSTDLVIESAPLHIFRHAGKYAVRVKANNNCETTRYITVLSKRIDSAGYPTFVAPVNAIVGEKVRFFDTTRNAVSWEWRFGESFDKTSKLKDPTYVYNTPGIKNVILIVNGKKQYYTKRQVLVVAKPSAKIGPILPAILPKKQKIAEARPIEPQIERPVPEPKVELPPVEKTPPIEVPPVPPAITAPDIDAEGLKRLFVQIQNKRKTTEDVGTYICDHFNIPVAMTNIRNSATKTYTLRDFSRNLKGLIITDIFIVKDPNTHCITSLKVEYKYSDW